MRFQSLTDFPIFEFFYLFHFEGTFNIEKEGAFKMFLQNFHFFEYCHVFGIPKHFPAIFVNFKLL